MSPPTSVARLLTRAFAVLALLIVVSGLSGAGTALVQHQTVEQLTDHVLPLQLQNAELRAAMSDGQRGLRGYLLSGDPTLLGNYYSAHADYKTSADDLRGMATGGEGVAIEAQLDRAEAWWAVAERQRQVLPRSDEAARFVDQGSALFLAFESANTGLDTALGDRADRLRDRSETLGVGTTAALVALTLAAALVAALTAVRTTRRITGPLGRLVTVLDDLGRGRYGRRAPTGDGPVEIRAVAAAVNNLAEQADRVRREEEEIARLRGEIRVLNTRVRQHLAVDSAMQEAATGLVATLGAEHAVLRIAAAADAPKMVTRHSAAGAAGSLDALACADIAWLGEHDLWLTADATDVNAVDVGDPVPDPEAAGWRAAGAGPVLTVAVTNGDTRLGALTLLRAAGRPGWSPVEIRLAESVAGDLGRGLHHARLFEQEQRLVAQLKELDSVKTDFMSTVSHELRTPLTSIAGYVEMLRDEDAGEVTPAQGRMLDVIKRNTTRLRALIEDLLILSRIEAGTFRTRRQTVDLAAIAGTVAAEAAEAAAKTGVTLTVDLAGPLPVDADKEQLDRVVEGLLSNAVKFAPGGTVTVTGRADAGEVVLCVADTGMGVPDAEQGQLFSRFFRATNAIHLAIPGTGLGLAIVRTIVENHDGTIEMTSAENDGTTVTVRLPLAGDRVAA
ncbi:ATP-binding protein [Spirilliplanes yamanashiensis]|uniref:Sensor-like histidine kinase SenX3 n=1 Tax=Spirilliplanes yamanashiensis TaxID=42233 RepID=A0A8J3Y779_9ACTN|nr:ATP-binding protein [Spirilliplanes yamanashiensis]MDP9817191.1 signal transduction histidine kinase [Spirilliplanes yamanashiensis]GIJ03156.1 hypothetical protein Sya03_25080 [Spirilliplanes yamanashiensis]